MHTISVYGHIVRFLGLGRELLSYFIYLYSLSFFLFLSFCNIDFNISNKVVIIMEINSWKVTKAVTNDLMREETDHFTSHSRHQYHINHIVQFSHSVAWMLVNSTTNDNICFIWKNFTFSLQGYLSSGLSRWVELSWVRSYSIVTVRQETAEKII